MEYLVTDKRMTRFNITLTEGVNFVISSLERMIGGEIFVPKIPSYRILDLVKAISSNGKVKILGIRPGEKISEEMISINDARNTREFDSFCNFTSKNFLNLDKKSYVKLFHTGKACKMISIITVKNSKFLNSKQLKKIISENISDFLTRNIMIKCNKQHIDNQDIVSVTKILKVIL